MSGELAPGTLVAGRYSVVRLLGRGSAKRVYLAFDRLAQCQVALALHVPAPGQDASLGARFSREGRAASVLRSPFTVRVFDVGKTADGTRYLVTEAVLGRGLDAAMADGAVEPAAAARWTMQVLAALAEAHVRGIVHRDVKPENVMLDPASPAAGGERGEEVARLTDFGLAKVLDQTLEGSVMLRTAQGTVMGTPDYMSPEHWHGEALDPRADLYSTGSMLYEMLLGRPPFQTDTLQGLCMQHILEPPPPFPANAPPMARALESVVRRALAKKPADRYPGADEMRVAIAAATHLTLPLLALVDPPTQDGPRARVELVSDAWPGAIQLVAAPRVVLGRDGDVVVRCLPATPGNEARSRTISRRHARIEWRGGRAFVVDLGSRGGTVVGESVVGPAGVELRNGSMVALGPHAWLRLEHPPGPAGALPPWARLVRTDPFGAGQVHVLVLTEAVISAAPDAAIRLPAAVAGDDVLRVRRVGERLMALSRGEVQPVPLGVLGTVRVGAAVISVAAED